MTPNLDGVNDYFYIDKLYEYNLEVYNRWGERMFKSETLYDNDFYGENLPDGTYYIIVTTSNKVIYKSWLQISR